MSSKRLLPLLVLLGGVLGILVCLAGIAAVRTVGSRLSHTNDSVFERIDTSLAAVRERVLGAQQRARELTITTEDIGQSLKQWTQQETSQRLASQLNVREKAEQLGVGLQQADHFLELAEATVESVQQAVEFGSSIGVPLDAAVVDSVHEQLASLRRLLQQATDAATGVHEGAADITAGKPPAERLNQVVQLALRVVATLGEIDVRLGGVAGSLSETRTSTQRLKSTTHSWIIVGQLGTLLVIAWMAAGQVCLCVHGWKSYRKSGLPGQP